MTDLIDEKPVYEAVIRYRNGLRSADDFIDPVLTITINNGAHNYQVRPEDIEHIVIRERK